MHLRRDAMLGPALIFVIAVLAAAVCAVTAMAQEPDEFGEMAPVERAVEWVDVGAADPVDVENVINALVPAFTGEYEGMGFFIVRSGDRVAVYGSEHERQVSREILENLAPAGEPAETTHVVPLQPDADLAVLQGFDEDPNAPEWEYHGDFVLLRGSQSQIAEGAALLAQTGAAIDESEAVCETVRLYYVRNPQSLQSLLTQLPPTIAQDTSVLASDDPYGPPVLIISGPRGEVQNIKRVIATLDVPQPEVRLDIWAFQISGRNAEDVAERAAQARDRIQVVSRLIRGYILQLEGFARDQLEANQDLIDDTKIGLADAADFNALTDIDNIITGSGIQEHGSRFLLTPSARGRHPLSLTETLATIITAPEGAIVAGEAPVAEDEEPSRLGVAIDASGLLGLAGVGAMEGRQQALARGLCNRLGPWLIDLLREDPEAITAWAEMVAHDGTGDEPIGQLLGELTRELAERGHAPRSVPDAEAILPRRLLARFGDEEYARTLSDSISGFMGMHHELGRNWNRVSPDQLRKRAADAQAALQDAEQALALDMQTLFLRPLEAELRQIVSDGGRSGLGSTSRTSISVLSGTEAEVVGSALSYFEVSKSPQLDSETLYRSEEFSRALGGIMPPSSQRDPVRRVVRIELDVKAMGGGDLDEWPMRIQQILPEVQVWPVQTAGKTSLMVVGTDADVRSATNILRSSGAIGNVQTTGTSASGGAGLEAGSNQVAPMSGYDGGVDDGADLPGGRLLALAMELGRDTEMWSALTEGAQLSFTPHILPGGSAAEVAIDFTVSHDDAGTNQETGPPPLSRVAQHTARTSVYVRALDLFALSSFSLQTSHARGDRAIPVLGNLPVLGQMFRFPRGPATVHHESVLMVYSTILPTGGDLAETIDAVDLGGER